ncbi:flavodoxin family protein [Chloroflexota bacterium]
MKTILIYYSLTGNTEKIAKAIQTGVQQITGHCDLFTIKEANPRNIYEYDLIGLGSPVYRGQEPDNVAAFVKNIRFVGGKHAFVFSTHCTMPLNFFASMTRKLNKKGLMIIGNSSWYGSHYNPPYSETPYLTDGHPDEIDLKEAESFGGAMVERSARVNSGEVGLVPKVPEFLPPPDLGGEVIISQPFSKLVKYSRQKCLFPACRLCMDNCPMDGIDLSVEPPVIAKPCLDCGFCEQLCPTNAMNADAWLEAPRKLIKRVHREFGAENLREAEAQGRFRRIIPEEEVGWDTPIHKVYKGRPRWIIGRGLMS